jgi:hypothetical protein
LCVLIVLSLEGNLEVFDGLSDALGGGQGGVEAGVPEQGDELLAADAGDQIARTDGGGEGESEGAQGEVSAFVSIAVVEGLEVIDIEGEQLRLQIGSSEI